MKKSRFTESQIVAILKEGEAGIAVGRLTRKHGISAATYCHWKSKYGGAGVPELKRLRELDAENAKFRRMYAGLALASRTYSVDNSEPSAKHEPIRIMNEEHDLPIARASQVARLSRAAYNEPGIGWGARDSEIIAVQKMRIRLSLTGVRKIGLSGRRALADAFELR